MRSLRRTFGFRSGILGLLLLGATQLLAGGPGKGDFAKRPGGGLASLEAKFNLSQLMGEPLVTCVFKWEAEVGYKESLPSDTVLWVKVQSGAATAFIRCSPVYTDSGKGFGMDSPGSPNWKDVLVLEWSGTKVIRTMDEKAAKAFWKAGFNVVDLQLSAPPARQGDKVTAPNSGKFVSNGRSDPAQGTTQTGAGMATGGPEKTGPGQAAAAGVAAGLSSSVPVKPQPNPVASRTAPLPSPDAAARTREAEVRAAQAAELQRRREAEEARRRARQAELAAHETQEAKEKAARVAEFQRRHDAEEANRQARQAARDNQQTREANEKAARLAELQQRREAEETARRAREAARRSALEEQRKKDQEAAEAAARKKK